MANGSVPVDPVVRREEEADVRRAADRDRPEPPIERFVEIVRKKTAVDAAVIHHYNATHASPVDVRRVAETKQAADQALWRYIRALCEEVEAAEEDRRKLLAGG